MKKIPMKEFREWHDEWTGYHTNQDYVWWRQAKAEAERALNAPTLRQASVALETWGSPEEAARAIRKKNWGR